MLAQGRVRELNKDLPIIAAAATTPTAASMKGLDAKTQRVVFMLLSQAFEDRRFRKPGVFRRQAIARNIRLP
jgi:hypothetical protein